MYFYSLILGLELNTHNISYSCVAGMELRQGYVCDLRMGPGCPVWECGIMSHHSFHRLTALRWMSCTQNFH